MAVTAQAGVVGVNLVRPDQPDRRRAGQETVGVEEELFTIVEIGVHARRDRVAQGQEVLAIEVRDEDALVAALEQVQLAVGFLLELIEIRRVPLVAVLAEVAEGPHAEVGVAEQKTAEIAVERLDARAHRNEIVVGADVGDLDLAERLLQGDVLAAPRDAGFRSGVDAVALAQVDVVQVELRGDAQGPVARLERGVALEQLERKNRVRQERVLAAVAEELFRAGVLGAHAGRRRHDAVFERRFRNRGQHHEDVVADDRQIALEHVLIVGIEAAIAHERILAVLPLVARPVGESLPPAIGHGNEVRHRIAHGNLERRPLAGRNGHLALKRDEARVLDGDDIHPRREAAHREGAVRRRHGLTLGVGLLAAHRHRDARQRDAAAVFHGAGHGGARTLRQRRRRRRQQRQAQRERCEKSAHSLPSIRTNSTRNSNVANDTRSPSSSRRGPGAGLPFTAVPLTLF